MRKLQHRNIKSLAQSCRAWERQELNASSRSTLLLIMHPASLGLRPTEKELVLPGPWTPYPAFSEGGCPSPALGPLCLCPVLKSGLVNCLHVQWFYSTRPFCFCKLSLQVPWEHMVARHATCSPWWPEPTSSWPFWMPISAYGAPYWTCSQAYSKTPQIKPLAFILISSGAHIVLSQ